jgi:transposase
MAKDTTPGAHTRKLQQARALELRARGLGVRQIAVDLGVGRSTAARRLRDALHDLGTETSDQMRSTIETRLDSVLQRLHELLDTNTDPRQELKILSAILACERDRSRLLGLALPANVVLSLEGLITDAPRSAQRYG